MANPHGSVKRLIVATLLIAITVALSGRHDVYAQADLIAPNILLRAIQTEQQVRYTASYIRPDDNAALVNVQVAITLPANVQLVDMLVTRQVQFHVVRVNRAGQYTLIWQVSRIAPNIPLDVFSFTLASPLNDDLTFEMTWQDETGARFVERFREVPPVRQIVTRQISDEPNFVLDDAQAGIQDTQAGTQNDNQNDAQNPGGFRTVGDTGVQIARVGVGQKTPVNLTVRQLDGKFNPPAALGAIWWCSVLQADGLPVGTSMRVLVPLRRPIAPFAVLQLFQQQPDGSWLALNDVGIVTADGQYVLYVHPGGIVATGGSPEIQPVIVPLSELIIEMPLPLPTVAETPVPPDAATNLPFISTNSASGITDGSSNTIQIGESTATYTPNLLTGKGDGVITVGSAIPSPTFAPATLVSITDGSSNTIQLGEATATPQSTLLPFLPTIAGITDGSSNTIQLGETRPIPTLIATNTPSSLTTGKGNGTITAGSAVPSSTIAPVTLTSITDGSSHTIQLGEITATATLPPLTTGKGNSTITAGSPIPSPTATLVGITDGSSNTILVGQATATPRSTLIPTLTPTLLPTLLPVRATTTPTQTNVATLSPLNPVATFGSIGGITGITSNGANATFASATAKIEIFIVGGTVQQCQGGKLNCVTLRRKVG